MQEHTGNRFNTRHFDTLAWIFFLGAAFFFLILAPLVQKGCFIDGSLYKTVAFNYAKDLGTFWSMKFTSTCMSQFCEQPPLYFFLLGSFYQVTGEYFFTDRFFTLLLFGLLICLLNLNFKLLFKNPRPYLLLTVFFLLSIQVFCWSYVNQIIEPLVCVLVVLCIYLFQRFLRSQESIYVVLYALACYFLFLGKGFQSCFMILLPIIYMILNKYNRDNYRFTYFTTLIFLFLCLFVITLYNPAIRWMDCYYRNQVVSTMNNVGYTTGNHLEILGRFFSEQVICLISVAVLFTYLKIKKKYPLSFVLKNFASNKLALSLFLTSFAGSLPYTLSLVQKGFYLIPAFLCFVLAVVYGLRRYWTYAFLLFAYISRRTLVKLLFFTLFVGGFVYLCFSFGLYKRNEGLLKDIDLIAPHLKEGEIVRVTPQDWHNFALHSYLYVKKQVSISTDTSKGHHSIRFKSSVGQTYSEKKTPLNTAEIDLFELSK